MNDEKKRESITMKEIREQALAYASSWTEKEFEYNNNNCIVAKDPNNTTVKEYDLAAAITDGYVLGAQRVLIEMSRMSIANIIKTLLEIKRDVR